MQKQDKDTIRTLVDDAVTLIRENPIIKKQTNFMFNLNKFISSSVTFRPDSMFAPDIDANKEKLTEEIQGKKVCVIGGAGSIGSNFIKAVLRFEPKSVVVADPTRTAWPSWFGMN